LTEAGWSRRHAGQNSVRIAPLLEER
jgi:hypothetical protein